MPSDSLPVPGAQAVEVRFTTLATDDAELDPKLLVHRPSAFTDPVFDGKVWRDRAFDNRRRVYTSVSRNHNLRTTQGRDLLNRGQMFGDISANATFATIAGAATATSATSLANSGASFPTTGGLSGSLQGHIVVARQRYGVILSNTGSVLTVDQWYDPTSTTGAVGTTPSSTTDYLVTPNFGMALWVGLSTDTTTPAATDVLRTADGLFGTGTAGSAASEQSANGLARAFVQPTFPSGGQSQLQYTWTYSGTGLITITKLVLANSKAAAGSLLFLDTLLNPTGQVANSGDTVQATWPIQN